MLLDPVAEMNSAVCLLCPSECAFLHTYCSNEHILIIMYACLAGARTRICMSRAEARGKLCGAGSLISTFMAIPETELE